MARSVALRAQNPSGSSARSMLGTIVSQKARSVWRCASLRPAASKSFSLLEACPRSLPTGRQPRRLIALQREDGRVVGVLAATERLERSLDARNDVVRARCAGERLEQPLLAEAAVAVDAARVDDAVGEEHEDVTGLERELGGQPVPLVERPEQRAGASDRLRLTIAHEQRQ